VVYGTISAQYFGRKSLSGYDAFDLLAEARWEQEGTRRAARRYREAAAAADPSSLPSGQKLLREVVPPLIAKVTELQAQGAAIIASPGGTKAKWAWPIQLLDASTLAVITVIQGMNAARGQGDVVSQTSAVSKEIAAAARDELNYRTWVTEQVAANKAAKEDQDWEHRDLLKAFKSRYPQADRKTWRRWAKKLELMQAEAWDEETSVQLGATLLHALVEAAPTRFEIAATPMDKGRSKSYLRLSAETLELMKDIEARAEVARPRLMPMLIPPIPWAYSD
jgi:DNA-directed RNA polymerase